MRTARLTTEVAMSAPTRPSETDALPMGSERNRSVMPFAASAVMASIVPSSPNIIVSVSTPGSRNEMYEPPPGTAIAPPKRNPNISNSIALKAMPKIGVAGCLAQWANSRWVRIQPSRTALERARPVVVVS